MRVVTAMPMEKVHQRTSHQEDVGQVIEQMSPMLGHEVKRPDPREDPPYPDYVSHESILEAGKALILTYSNEVQCGPCFPTSTIATSRTINMNVGTTLAFTQPGIASRLPAHGVRPAGL